MGLDPLEIPKILQNILEFLDSDTSSLNSARLVNSQWNQESKKLLKNHTLLLNTLRDISSVMNIYTLNSFPYQMCIFGSRLWDPEDSNFIGRSTIASEFLRKFGPLFTKIHLSLSNINNREFNKMGSVFDVFPNLDTFSILLKALSNTNLAKENFNNFFGIGSINNQVKHLYINYTGFDKEQYSDLIQMELSPLQVFVRALFHKLNLQNLQCVSCKIPEFAKMRNHQENDSKLQLESSKLGQEILEYILHIEINQINLSSIEFLSKVNNLKLNYLGTKLNPQVLKSLNLQLEESVQANSLSVFLAKFTKTLRNLYLEFASNKINLNIEQSMQNLVNLTIKNYSGDFNFLKKLTKLKTIVLISRHLNYNYECNTSIKKVSLVSISKLSKGSIKIKYIKENGDSIKVGTELSHKFPNLKCLHLDQADNKILQGIFANLQNLYELKIKGNFTDSGICGEKDNILRVLMESNYQGVNFQPRFPAISHLKHLQVCSIEAAQITDASLLFGVAFCSLLKRLSVHSTLELITELGVKSLSSLRDLEDLKIFVRNVGWMELPYLVN